MTALQVDHVELFVPDRHEAARWYERVLGLTIIRDFEEWAADPKGPLMISNDSGGTKLALFEGTPQLAQPTAGFHRVAFRADADGFVAFVRRLSDLQLKTDRDHAVTANSVVDHRKALSIYFTDPYGHRLELTTYECDRARNGLAPESDLLIVNESGIRAVEGRPDAPLMASADDARRVLEACFSAGVHSALLYADNLTPGFFDLSSGDAGSVLQKLRNYGVRLAVVCPAADARFSTRFGEMLAEERQGRDFSVFETRDDAIRWLAHAGPLA